MQTRNTSLPSSVSSPSTPRIFSLLPFYMPAGAEKWFYLCEELSAGHRFTKNCSLPPLTFRPKVTPVPLVLDVVMADTPAVSTPSAGMKRSREDDVGEEPWDFDLRAEKVSTSSKLSEPDGWQAPGY